MKLFFRYILIFCSLFAFANRSSAAIVITKFAAQTVCATSFPTAFVAGSFTIKEGAATDFTKNQSGRTIIFTAPAGWAFNTTAGTYSVSSTGTDLSA